MPIIQANSPRRVGARWASSTRTARPRRSPDRPCPGETGCRTTPKSPRRPRPQPTPPAAARQEHPRRPHKHGSGSPTRSRQVPPAPAHCIAGHGLYGRGLIGTVKRPGHPIRRPPRSARSVRGSRSVRKLSRPHKSAVLGRFSMSHLAGGVRDGRGWPGRRPAGPPSSEEAGSGRPVAAMIERRITIISPGGTMGTWRVRQR
jgi:hypothetical protein